MPFISLDDQDFSTKPQPSLMDKIGDAIINPDGVRARIAQIQDANAQQEQGHSFHDLARQEQAKNQPQPQEQPAEPTPQQPNQQQPLAFKDAKPQGEKSPYMLGDGTGTISQAPDKVYNPGYYDESLGKMVPMKIDLNAAHPDMAAKDPLFKWVGNALSSIPNTIAGWATELTNNGGDFLSKTVGPDAQKFSASDKVAATGSLALSAASALIPEWREFQLVLNASPEFVQKPVNSVFDVIGKPGVAASNFLVDQLPISDEEKAKLRPVADQVGGFLSQVIALKVLHSGYDKLTTGATEKAATRDANASLQGQAVDYINSYSSTKITADSTPEEIKKAYYEAQHATHPDIKGSIAESNVGGLGAAYQFLTDPEGFKRDNGYLFSQTPEGKTEAANNTTPILGIPENVAKSRTEFQSVIKALPENHVDVLTEAVGKPIDTTKVQELTPQERQIIGIALNAAKNIPGADVANIERNIQTIESTGVKVPTVPGAEQAPAQVTAPTAAPTSPAATPGAAATSISTAPAPTPMASTAAQQVVTPAAPAEAVPTPKEAAKTTPAPIEEAKQAAPATQDTLEQKPSIKTPEYKALDDYIYKNTGKHLEKASPKDVVEAMKATGIKLPDQGGQLLDKVSNSKNGFDWKNFETNQGLRGTLNKGALTDAFSLINDPKASETVISKWRDTQVKKDAKSLMKQDASLSLSDAMASARTYFDKGVKNTPAIPYEQIFKDHTKGTPAEIAGHTYLKGEVTGTSSGVHTVLHAGKHTVVVSSDKLAMMKKALPNAKMIVTGKDHPVHFIEDGKIKGVVMPLKSEEGAKSPFKREAKPTEAKKVEAKKEVAQPKEKTVVRNEKQIEAKKSDAVNTDVGEKIGGARKDIFEKSKESIMKEFSDQEIADLSRDKAIPTVDYKALAENGTSEDALGTYTFFVANLGKKITSGYRGGSKLQKWVQGVQALRTIAKSMVDGNEKIQAATEEMIGRDKSLKASLDMYQHFDFLNNEQIRKYAVNVRTWSYSGDSVNGTKHSEYLLTQNGNYVSGTRAETPAALYNKVADLLNVSKDNRGKKPLSQSISVFTQGGKAMVAFKRGSRMMILERFNTVEEARAAKTAKMDEYVKTVEKRSSFNENSFRGTENAALKKSYRNGKDVSAEKFMNTFGFRGVEFGNWVSQGERIPRLNMAFDSFKDLANILGVPDKALSLNGELGFAFGSRGHAGVLAHYEPDKIVINITKENGAGTIAHEWWHALDNYLSRKEGRSTAFITETQKYSREEVQKEFTDLMKFIKSSEVYKRSSLADEYKGKSYYKNPTELGARAFEVFVKNRMLEAGDRNDFLVNVLDEDKIGELDSVYPYAVGKEGKELTEKMGNLISALKTEGENSTLYNIPDSDVEKIFKREFVEKKIREIARTTDPNLRARLTFAIAKEIIDKHGNVSWGQFNRGEGKITISQRQGSKSTLENTIVHEIMHNAFGLFDHKEHNAVIRYVNSLDIDERRQILGKDPEGNWRYDAYVQKYGSRSSMLAEEIVVTQAADQHTTNSFILKLRNIIASIIKVIHQVTGLLDKQFKGIKAREIFQHVFNAEGDYFKDKWRNANDEVFANIGKVGEEKGITTDKGALRAQKVFESAWEKLYGEKPKVSLTDLLKHTADQEVIKKGFTESFNAGKEIQRGKTTDAQEFRTAANLYVKEFVPKEIQGKFMDKIINATNAGALDTVMKSVDSELSKYDKADQGKMEKRLKAEYQIKQKFDNMVRKYQLNKIKTREKNAERVKEIRTTLNAMFKEKTATAQEIKAQVIEYVKNNIPKDKQGLFLKSVKDAKSAAGLKRVMAAVDVRRAKYERVSLINSINNIANNIKNLPVDLQRTIIEITSNIELKGHTAKTIARLEATRAYLETRANDHEMPRRVLNELGILERTPLKDLTNDQLIKINNKFKQYELVGKNIMKNRIVTAKKGLEDTLAILEKSSVNLDKTNPDDKLNPFNQHDLSIPEDDRTLSQKAKEALTWDKDRVIRLKLALNTSDRLFNALDGHQDYTGANYRIFKEPVDLAWNKWKYQSNKITRPLYMMLNEMKMTEKNSQRIAIYAYDQQRGGRAKLLEDNKITEKQIESIHLDEKEMAVYNFMRQHLEQIHPLMSDYMETEHNSILGKPENFFPMMTDFAVTKPLVQEFEQMGRMKSVPFGSTKERRENAHQVLKLDAFQVFASYVDKGTYMLAMDPVVRNLTKIAESDRYRAAVGNNAQTTVLTWLDVLARKGGALTPETNWDRKINELNNNLSVAMLGLRITSMAKQPLAMLNGAADIGPYYAAMGVPAIRDEHWMDFMNENSSEIRERFEDPFLEEISHDKTLGKLQQASMYPLEMLDVLTARAIWAGAYAKYMDDHGLQIRTIDENGDKGAINKNADGLKYADLIMRKTQASGAFKDTPTFLTGKNRKYAKLIMKFQMFVLNDWNYFSEDIPDKWKNNKKAAVNAVVFMALASMANSEINTLYQMITGTGTASKNPVRDAFTGMVQNMIQTTPFLGQIMSSISYGGSSPVPLVETAHKFFASLAMVFSSKNTSTQAKNSINDLSIALGVIYGIPTDQAKTLLNSWLFPKSNGKSRL